MLRLLAFLAVLAAAPYAQAQQLIYQPLNPAFGGSPLNYSWLLQSAEAQKDPVERASAFNRNPLTDFQNSLQRQILNNLSREIIFDRFGDLDLTQAGRFDLGDFQIDITPGLSEVSIRIFNVLTGEETTVSIPNL
jgi:curli production assembly/transport component CsgF